MATQRPVQYIPRNDLSIFRSYTVEIPLTNIGIGSKNPFLVNEYLQPENTGSVIYTGMECWIVTQQTNTDSGRPVVSQADAAQLAISLVWGKKTLLYLQPYIGFVSLINFGMIRRLANLEFSITDSYAQVMGAGVTAGTSALVTFYFNPVKKGR